MVALACLVSSTAPAAMRDFRASVDRADVAIPKDRMALVRASLQNGTTTVLYVTGFKIEVSENASAELYNPSFLHQTLRVLAPHQTWDGPLAAVFPGHGGPLLVEGSIGVQGGPAPNSQTVLASMPFQLEIQDPERDLDGSSSLWRRPSCERPTDHCCDVNEASCLSRGSVCAYVAQGYGHARVCVNREPGKLYDRIFDLRASADGAHIAYIAGARCSDSGVTEKCQRLLVVDEAERSALGEPSQLELSPDGRHVAYVSRANCLLRDGHDVCAGAATVMRDGEEEFEAEAVRRMRFSADSAHLGYDAGTRCGADRCAAWRPMTDGHAAAGTAP